MPERQLIPIEVAGGAMTRAVSLLLEDPDIGEVFWWWRPEMGTHPARTWNTGEGARLFAVAEKGNGIIGLAALSNIRRDARYARLSCAVAEPYRLAGAGHWAATETIRRGVRLDGLRHVEAFVREDGTTARRVLESMGFRVREASLAATDVAAPARHLCLRLDLPEDAKGHFLMAPPVGLTRPSSRPLSAALFA
jgi:hypothetical protein